MLKKLQLFLIIFALLPTCLLAQSANTNSFKNEAVLFDKIAHPFPQNVIQDNTQNQEATFRDLQEEIGTTYFDNQTYGSANHRLFARPDGSLSAGWHYSAEPAGWTDRGTGHNNFDGTAWSIEQRVEGDVRGGYPGFAANNLGDEFVSSHINEGIWQMGFHTKLAGETEWTIGTIPTGSAGTVWGKIAIGGDNEEIIHAVGITLSPDFGGVVYEGLTQHLLYYRSADKGATWEVQDVILPGVDSTNYLNIEAESYTIAAKGNTVAVAIFPSWGDARLLKSVDGGETWETTILLDFPFDKYDDFVYTIEDTGMDPDDPELPDSLAILTTDNTASLIIDNNDMVHLAVGRMYVSADGSGDRFYFPGTDGIFYWNESNGENNMQLAVEAKDYNANDSLDIANTTQIAIYFRSLTSMPSLGVDADNTVFMTYSSINEQYVHEDDDQFFRQIYITKQTADNEWETPYEVINTQTINEAFIPFTEGVFPSIPPVIGERIPLIYQQDFRPGMLSFGDEDAPELASIVYVDLSKEDFSIISDLQEIPVALEASVTPNPAFHSVFLEYQPEEATTIQYELVNLLGATILSGGTNDKSSSFYRTEIEIADLAQGIYFVRLTAEGKEMTFKVVKK